MMFFKLFALGMVTSFCIHTKGVPPLTLLEWTFVMTVYFIMIVVPN